MKRKVFFGILLAIIMAFTLASPGMAQKAPPKQAKTSSAVNQTISPWFTGYADDNTSAHVGAYPSVAYNPANELPYISYYDGVNGNLMLANPNWAGGQNCGTNNTWWCRVVDGDGKNGRSNANVGSYSSIAFWEPSSFSTIAWKLGIAYHDATHDALKLAVWTQYFQSSLNNWTIETIDKDTSAGASDGIYNSLKFASDGTPRIAYYWLDSGGNGSLWLAVPVSSGGTGCSGSTNAGKWTCEEIDPGGASGGAGEYASLDLAYNGRPFIAYYNAHYDTITKKTTHNLKLAQFVGVTDGNCGPGNSYDCEVIDATADDVGKSASVLAPHFYGDNASIAYYDATNGNLKYASPASSNANCASNTWYCRNIDTMGASIIGPAGISLSTDSNGYPIIAYMTYLDVSGPSYLAVARTAAAVGQFIGNCGDVPPGLLFEVWDCQIIDGGYGYGNVDLAYYASIAFSPTGVATIAYNEEDSYNDTTYLKVAYDQLEIFLPLIKR